MESKVVYFVTCLLFMAMFLVAVGAAEPDCFYKRSSCDVNRNPCDPLCLPEVMSYRGRSSRLYVTCDVSGGCTSNKCPPRKLWDQAEQQCTRWGKTVAAVDAVDNTVDRCEQGKFNCRFNNPCLPSACTSNSLYPGLSPNKYVECGGDGTCYEKTCSPRFNYEHAAQSCTTRDTWDTSDDGTGDPTKERPRRCDFGTHNCKGKNPCFPTPCDPTKTVYPGRWHNKYVECDGLACQELRCPPDQSFNRTLSECQPKPLTCDWEPIVVTDPVEACADESDSDVYSFFSVPFSSREEGFPNLDGKLDCENLGGLYYTEDTNLPADVNDRYFYDCFFSTGLCVTVRDLTDPDGFDFTAERITANTASPTGYDSVIDTDYTNGGTFSSCVSHDVLEQYFWNHGDAKLDCLNKGGAQTYRRQLTHYGSCTTEVPCDTVSSENVKIYNWICK